MPVHPPEPKVLDDAARTAGIHGPGYPIRAGAEIFYLSRLTKDVRNAFCAWAVQDAEANLRASASLLPAAEYAVDVRAHRKAKDAGHWSWGGIHTLERMASHSGGAKLFQLLLSQHHEGIYEDTVEWLMKLWSCPSCQWRGVQPEEEAGVQCKSCNYTVYAPLEDNVQEFLSTGKLINGSEGGLCCPKSSPDYFYHCPQCRAVLSSVKNDQMASAFRELSAADPRTPSPANGTGANGHKE